MRQLVYGKYGGHCAYCGCELEYKDMQVDHADITIWMTMYGNDKERAQQAVKDNSINGIENLMPACRQCNYYKGVDDIEKFRYKVKELLENTCINTFQARLAMKYRIIKHTPWDGKFYFEKIKEGGEE